MMVWFRGAAWTATAVTLAVGLALWALGFRIYLAEVAFRTLALPLAAIAAASLAAELIGVLRGVRASRPRLALALAALGLASTTLGRALDFMEPRGEPAGMGRAVSLITYNVLYRGGDPAASVRMLGEHDVDVFAFQEVTPAWHRKLAAALGSTHPHRASRPVPGTHGLSVFSRFPLGDPVYLENRAGRPIAQCMPVHSPGAHFLLCNVHLASPAAAFGDPDGFANAFRSNATLRTSQWRELRELVRRRFPEMQERLVVAGDLNTLESEPLYFEIRRDLVDAFRHRRWTPGATFPNGHGLPRPAIRIDYVLATPAFLPEHAEVLPPSGSDHLGVRAVLRVPSSEGGGVAGRGRSTPEAT